MGFSQASYDTTDPDFAARATADAYIALIEVEHMPDLPPAARERLDVAQSLLVAARAALALDADWTFTREAAALRGVELNLAD